MDDTKLEIEPNQPVDLAAKVAFLEGELERMREHLEKLEATANAEVARLTADADKLRAERDGARAETAEVVAQRPATPVVASPTSPHAIGAGSGRCSRCEGAIHPPGQHSHCADCHRPTGALYSTSDPNGPVCPTCGSAPWTGPSLANQPKEIPRPRSFMDVLTRKW